MISFRKLINTFYKKYLEKPIITFLLLDSILLMIRLTVPKKLKQKHGYPSKGANKIGKS